MGFIDEEQEKIAGFPATPEGQKQVVDIVMNIVASLPEEMGQGVYYWEPLCVPDGQSSWNESMGILAEDGTVMEAVKSFLFTREQACPNKIAKIYQPKVITCADHYVADEFPFYIITDNFAGRSGRISMQDTLPWCGYDRRRC